MYASWSFFIVSINERKLDRLLWAFVEVYKKGVFLFPCTKVAMHAVFVKGRFTLRVKNLLCSLRSCGIFYPLPLTNTLCFAGRCLGKRKKCCSLIGCPLCHFVTRLHYFAISTIYVLSYPFL